MVFYRKYRPQKISELDSQEIRDSLTAVLSLPEVPHAFLFTGPKGLGKTSAARIMAKAVNCEKVSKVSKVPKVSKAKEKKDINAKSLTANFENIEPCNECETCKSITNGTNLDIFEIDAASNRGIDEIRDLREKIKLSAVSARKKVYIIDEVHMLTTEAFNALLKTLEEPPPHAMFILCTTELQKVPATILSRCFHLTFRPATQEELSRSLKRAADAEGLKIDEEAVKEIMLLVDGGLRDGHKILEELAATGEKVINKELVEKLYKVESGRNYVVKLLESLSKRDVKEALGVIEKMVEDGVDIKYFLQQLLGLLHQELLEQIGIEEDKLKIKNLKFKINMEDIRDLILLFTQAYQEMRYAVIAQLPLELAIIEYGNSIKFKNQNSKLEPQEEQSAEKRGSFVATNDNTVSVASLRKQVGNIARVKALYGEPKVDTAKIENIPTESVPSINLLQISNSEITREWLDNFWSSLINNMKQHNHTVAGVLRGCMIKQYDKKTLIIETAYKFHKEKLDNAKTRTALEMACKALTGIPTQVEVILRK